MKSSTLAAVTLALCLLASTAWANPVCQNGYEAAREDLKQSLLERYSNNFSTVKMLLDAGMKDYNSICEAPDDDVSQGIIENLHGRYYPNFSTIWMLYESNYADYQALQ